MQKFSVNGSDGIEHGAGATALALAQPRQYAGARRSAEAPVTGGVRNPRRRAHARSLQVVVASFTYTSSQHSD
eukprot:6190429-Pleurochrysis_carterae.AAC.1